MMFRTLYSQQTARRGLSTMSCILHGLGASVAALILVFGFIGHRVLHSRLAVIAAEHEAALKLKSDADAIEAASSATQAMLEQAMQRRERVLARIPPQANEIAFLDQLSASAGDSGLQIRDYRPGSRSECATHHELELVLRAEGSYESLCRFVAALETIPRMCRISSLSATSPPEGKTNMIIELKIALAYGLKPAETI